MHFIVEDNDGERKSVHTQIHNADDATIFLCSRSLSQNAKKKKLNKKNHSNLPSVRLWFRVDRMETGEATKNTVNFNE